MASHSPTSDYLADSEPSDLVFDYKSDSDCLTPTMKPSYKRHSSRHATVRTPSEEDLYQQDKLFIQSRRPSTPYAFKRHPSHPDEQPLPRKAKEKQQRRDKPAPVTAEATNNPSTTAPASALSHPGVQSYNNPAGSTAAFGFNHVYLHGSANPNAFSTDQPFAISHNHPSPPCFHQVDFAGQPSVFVNMPEQLGGYQNAVPFNPGVKHYQPQVPDTSFGPMCHTYVPRFDSGGVYMVQPGAVCHSILSHFDPSLFFHSPPLTIDLQEVQPLTFAPKSFILRPQPTIKLCPSFIASASAVTTIANHRRPDGVVAPR